MNVVPHREGGVLLLFQDFHYVLKCLFLKKTFIWKNLFAFSSDMFFMFSSVKKIVSLFHYLLVCVMWWCVPLLTG